MAEDLKSRRTRQKELIMDILRDAGVPLTAGEIYARGVKQQPTLAKSTVYRNLEAMQERGEVIHGQLENGERFYAAATPHAHKHYMICKTCNRMLDLPACPMEKLEQELAASAGFTVTDHVLQLYGYCKECAEQHQNQKK